MEKQLIPKLRFSEFSGQWKQNNLQSLCKKAISYGIVQTGENIEKGIPCVRVVDLTSTKFDIDMMIKTSEEINASYKKTILEENELMLALRGDIGLVKLVDKNLVGANITRGIARLSAKENLISPLFLNWVIQSDKSINNINKQVNGSALKEIPLGGLRKVSICFSDSKLEQIKIATFLTAVDTKISQLTKKKELLEQYKKGVMQKIFSQELRFKDDNGNYYPDWESKKLGEIFKISAGGDIGKENVSQEKTEVYKYPIYANSEKRNGLYGYSDIYKIDFDCITITGRGSLGLAIARFEKFYPIVRLLVLKPKIKLNVSFFENAINQLNILSESTGVPQLTAPQISSYIIGYPLVEEQTKIADFLSAIDVKINHISNQLEQTNIFKKGLLQQMFV